MDIVIIDGQGGGLLRRAHQALRAGGVTKDRGGGHERAGHQRHAPAGASAVARTGENAVMNAARARILAGPIGLVMANSMLAMQPGHGPRRGGSPAHKVLIPVAKCGRTLRAFRGSRWPNTLRMPQS